MKKKTLLVLLLAVMGATLELQAQNTASKLLPAFNWIKTNGKVMVYLTKGPTEELRLNGGKEELHNIIYEVKDSTLSLSTKSGYSGEPIPVYIYYKQVGCIAVGENSKVITKAPLLSDFLVVHVTDNGSAALDVAVTDIQLYLEDTAELAISGKANTRELFTFGEESHLESSQLKVLHD